MEWKIGVENWSGKLLSRKNFSLRHNEQTKQQNSRCKLPLIKVEWFRLAKAKPTAIEENNRLAPKLFTSSSRNRISKAQSFLPSLPRVLHTNSSEFECVTPSHGSPEILFSSWNQTVLTFALRGPALRQEQCMLITGRQLWLVLAVVRPEGTRAYIHGDEEALDARWKFVRV